MAVKEAQVAQAKIEAEAELAAKLAQEEREAEERALATLVENVKISIDSVADSKQYELIEAALYALMSNESCDPMGVHQEVIKSAEELLKRLQLRQKLQLKIPPPTLG